MSDQVGDVRTVQQCFGRDAADVHAYPAEFVALDDCGGKPKLCSANSADIPSGPAAYDNYVERIGHEFLSVLESVYALPNERQRVFQHALQRLEEPGSGCAVNHPVVA
jgi:hypothetical protein